MDRFPEALHRFEKVVNMKSLHSGRELRYAFRHWAGKRWVDSYLQKALQKEAKKEDSNVKGKAQIRYRDLKTGRFIKKP